MTEEEVRRIAEAFVVEQSLDECQIVSVRRRTQPLTIQLPEIENKWVVQLRFEAIGDESVDYGLVIVDDITGVAEAFDTL